ncbi:hypothetical protein [Rhizobium leguminosarum]|uniref:hypothetical protein n=1 Tax=Rhizobium leguminosarum TaxID=384 RepID=UPI001C9572C4|nr:hypothetical protein [Rhizobium leguminosarum]MBY5608746.1 hypothetical protein [Rhizobium leguminosarum]MBY5657319.1 hypothetical protein [Rhizobium leguminosarum]
MNITEIYDLCVQFVEDAERKQDTDVVREFLTKHSFRECPTEDEKFDQGHDREIGPDRVFVQYRSYDTSQAFSIRPDMNIYLLKLVRNGVVISRQEVRFLDQY